MVDWHLKVYRLQYFLNELGEHRQLMSQYWVTGMVLVAHQGRDAGGLGWHFMFAPAGQIWSPGQVHWSTPARRHQEVGWQVGPGGMHQLFAVLTGLPPSQLWPPGQTHVSKLLRRQ